MLLHEQLEHLDRTLLSTITTQFPDPLSAPEKAQVHAYLVLSHAVLEEYLEASFERYFDRVSGWFLAPMVPVEGIRLAFAVAQYIPKEESGYKTRTTPQLILGLGRKNFLRQVGDNNGLKSSNVLGLSKLVGLHWPDLENALNAELNDLDTLGVKRGAAGHLSPYTEKTTAISISDGPDDVRKWVRDGVIATQSVVAYLNGLIRSQEPASLIGDWDGN